MATSAYKNAHKHFGLKPGDGLCLHHKDPTLKKRDPKRYEEWRPEDLVVMTTKEHSSLHRKGAVVLEKSKIKQSANMKGKNAMPVCQYTLDGEFVKEWPSMRDADAFGFCHVCIGKVCKGKWKSHKGYKWAYKNPNDAKISS